MKKEENNLIDPLKHYSIRKTAKLIPWINCEPTLQKIIHYDIEENQNQLFKVIVLKRNKQRRYYIKGEHILNVIKKYKADDFKQHGTRTFTDETDKR